MVVSIVRAFKWTPHYVIQNLFVDKRDYLGIEFWYEDIKRQNAELKASTTKK